jgi:ribose transport system permease protein
VGNKKIGLNDVLRFLQGEIGLLVILVILCIVFALKSEFFITGSNLLNVTRQIAIVLTISIGMLCVVLTGEIDLSVGSTAALAGMTCAVVILHTGNQWLAILAAVCVGFAVGACNGAFTVLGKIPSFIVTLAMMGIVRGIVLVWSEGKSISGLPEIFSIWGARYVFGIIPVPTIISLLLVVLGFVFIHKTKHGVYIKAIGSNAEAAMLSTIPIRRYKFVAFITTGFLCAIGGIMTTSKLLSAQPTASEGIEMDVLSAVILGGASLSGGVGTVTGTLIGALTIGVINNGMNLLRINPFYQQIVKGAIILAAVLLKRSKR